MDQEVAKTLGELELKLQELEHELTSIGGHERPAEPPIGVAGPTGPAKEPTEPPHPPGKLIDEAVEQGRDTESDAGTNTDEQAADRGDGFGGPAVFGGEELPAQAGATIEREWTVEPSETAYGEIPTPPPSSQPGEPVGPATPPTPTPQPPPTTPPGAPPSTRPPEPPAPSTPPGMHAPSTPPGMHAPTPPGMHATSTLPGVDAPSTPPGMHAPRTLTDMHRQSTPPLGGNAPPGERGYVESPEESQRPPKRRIDPRRPAAVEESQALDLAELVRFRDKLQRTMGELIDEYGKLLPVDRPPR